MHALNWKVSLVINVNVMLLSMISTLLHSFSKHEEEVFLLCIPLLRVHFMYYVFAYQGVIVVCTAIQRVSQLPRSCTMRSPHVGATVIQILLLPVALTSIIMRKHGFSRHFVDQPYWYCYKITSLKIIHLLFAP